jgi:hypothetical protein
LKENLVLLATIFGLGIYAYNFIGKKRRVIGMMAQEVFEKFPESVVVGGDDPKKDPWKIQYDKLFKAMGSQYAGELKRSLEAPVAYA